MTWEDYFENYDFWAESTQLSNISKIEDLKNAKACDIAECCACLLDEKASTRLLRKAVQKGFRFTGEQISDISGMVNNKELMREIALNVVLPITDDDLIVLEEYLNTAELNELAKKSGIPGVEDEEVWIEEPIQNERPARRGFWAGLGLGLLFGDALAKGDTSPQFKIGDRVRVIYSGLEGTIIDVNYGQYMVGFANGKPAESYSANEIRKTW